MKPGCPFLQLSPPSTVHSPNHISIRLQKACFVQMMEELSPQFIPLAEKFYTRLLADGGITVGDALQRLIVEDAGRSEFEDAPQTLNLLGDPALQFYAP